MEWLPGSSAKACDCRRAGCLICEVEGMSGKATKSGKFKSKGTYLLRFNRHMGAGWNDLGSNFPTLAAAKSAAMDHARDDHAADFPRRWKMSESGAWRRYDAGDYEIRVAVPSETNAAVSPRGAIMVNRPLITVPADGVAVGTVSIEKALLRRIVNRLAAVFMLVGAERDDEERRNFVRASGCCVCDCGATYYAHVHDPFEPWLTVLCDGQRVKL